MDVFIIIILVICIIHWYLLLSDVSLYCNTTLMISNKKHVIYNKLKHFSKIIYLRIFAFHLLVFIFVKQNIISYFFKLIFGWNMTQKCSWQKPESKSQEDCQQHIIFISDATLWC